MHTQVAVEVSSQEQHSSILGRGVLNFSAGLGAVDGAAEPSRSFKSMGIRFTACASP